MKHMRLLKWFGGGFISTLAVIVVFGLAVPAIVSAQDGNPNMEFVPNEPSSSVSTDDPEGRNYIPAPDELLRVSNRDSFAESGNSSPPFTDNPPDESVKGGGGPTTVLVIPAADFRSDGREPGNMMFWFNTGYLRGGTDVCVQAPVYLPNNAKIDNFFFSAMDGDDANNITVTLFKVQNYTGVVTPLGSANTSGNSLTMQMPYYYLLAEDTVIYPTYTYYLGTCMLSSDLKLFSVQIWYTP
jgi:hypothetical protein